MVLCHYPFHTLFYIIKSKREKQQKIESFLLAEKHCLIQMEKYAVEKNKRTSFYRSILQLKPTFYHLNSVKRSVKNNQNINFFPKHYKLHFKWFLDMNYCYDVTFSNNILVLGEIGYGKTSFVQNLDKKKIFG